MGVGENNGMQIIYKQLGNMIKSQHIFPGQPQETTFFMIISTKGVEKVRKI